MWWIISQFWKRIVHLLLNILNIVLKQIIFVLPSSVWPNVVIRARARSDQILYLGTSDTTQGCHTVVMSPTTSRKSRHPKKPGFINTTFEQIHTKVIKIMRQLGQILFWMHSSIWFKLVNCPPIKGFLKLLVLSTPFIAVLPMKWIGWTKEICKIIASYIFYTSTDTLLSNNLVDPKINTLF